MLLVAESQQTLNLAELVKKFPQDPDRKPRFDSSLFARTGYDSAMRREETSCCDY